MEITVLGIDLAKNTFHLHGVSQRGTVVLRKKLSRNKLLGFVRNLPPTLIGIEACGGAHHWAREFSKCGHEVRIMAPQFVKPYVKSNKNDMADAEAICEAVQRPSMRFVEVKSTEQQEILMLHRVRARVVKQRTALINEVRGLVMEFGIAIPRGTSHVMKFLNYHLEDCEETFSSLGMQILRELRDELLAINSRLSNYDRQISQIAKHHPVCQRLMTVPGVGPVTATAVMATVGSASQFKNSRQFASWLGLVPRQSSTGGKNTLLGISKRGDRYTRTLLIHGARAVMRYLTEKKDRRSLWAMKLKEKKGTNKAAVALANKTARVMWVLLTGKDTRYREFSAA